MKTSQASEHLERLHDGKSRLRRSRMEMSLPEKVRQVVELQKIHIAIVRRRRALKPLERMWKL